MSRNQQTHGFQLLSDVFMQYVEKEIMKTEAEISTILGREGNVNEETTPRPRRPPIPKPRKSLIVTPPSRAPSPCLNPKAPDFTPRHFRNSTPSPMSQSQRSVVKNEVSPSDAYSALAKQFKKPVVNLEKFAGDPTKYVNFVRQFNTRIVENSDTYDEILVYLLQFTTGEPHNIAQGYSHLNAELAFQVIFDEFQRRYGDPEYVPHVGRKLE